MKDAHWTLKSPDAWAAELWRRVPAHIRLTFFASVLLGLAVHFYMFANKLPNHDDIAHLFSMNYGTASGRWLLPAVSLLDGPFSTPWLLGLLSVLFLAVTVCLSVSLLRIRRPLACAAAAAVMVSFPTVTGTFTYMFTAGTYFFSLMLAALSAYLAVRFRRGALPGAAALVLSMGIYQSYFEVAAVLMVGALLLEALDGERSFWELIRRGLRLLAVLAAAMAVYLLAVRVTTRHVPLVDYMGLSSMGSLSLRELPRQILQSYWKYVCVFFLDKNNYHFSFLPCAFILVILCCGALGALLLRKRRLGPARTALVLLLAALYPLAGDLIYIMVPGGEVHVLMIYGLCYILVAPIALTEYAELHLGDLSARTIRTAARWVILAAVILAAYSYAVTANSAYLKMDLSLRQCTSYSTRLLDKIESCEGYREGMPVALLGSGTREDALSPTPALDSVQVGGVFDFGRLRTSYTYGLFLRYYLGFTGEVFLDGSEKALALADLDEVRDMPLYPEAGGVRVIDGTVVVKLNG